MRGLTVERSGSGPRLVLVHGFTQTGRSWRPIAADLTQDHEVVTVDAPGHGGSSTLATDLVEGAALLVAAGGSATYIGYSMGARLVLHAALDHPTQVQRLILLGGTAGIEEANERAERRRDDEALADDIERDGVDAFLVRWLALPLFAGLASEATDLDDRRRNTAAGLASSLRRAGTGTQEDLWPRVASLAMPVLLVTGGQDAKFRGVAERMAAVIGPNACTAVVAEAGHAAHLEQRAAFVAVLRAWLSANPISPA